MSSPHDSSSPQTSHLEPAGVESPHVQEATTPVSAESPTLRPHPNFGEPIRRRDLFKGHGEVSVWSLMRPNALDPFRAALWCELEPRGRVGRHRQELYPELIICVSGAGVAEVGGQRKALAPGVCITLALGQTLALTNHGAEPLVYLIIKAESVESSAEP